MFITALLKPHFSVAQTFILTVNNGYGSGAYQTGDTVNVWSMAYDSTQTFEKWTGDTLFLTSSREWHTTLIMPNQNLAVTAVINNMPNYSITNEQIMGVNNLKKVYHFIPTTPKGVIFFFHGTGGSASGWTDKIENRSLVNAAIADGFGIIITEAEEITLNTDLNGDGKLRWKTFQIDTLNGIDYLNIKAITDTLINRGLINSSTPKFSIGMSNGGSFSAAISAIYNFAAGISYCASSSLGVFEQRQNPFAFRMAKFDDNEEVGSTGNYEAFQNDSVLATRGICHNYLLYDRQPIYPQRFSRVSGISLTTSQNIFNELVVNGQLDNNNYAVNSSTLATNIQSNPTGYPTIISLTPGRQSNVISQIAASNAEHNFFSDFNFETLKFFNQLCGTTASIDNQQTTKNKITVYPNPTNKTLFINIDNNSSIEYQIENSIGHVIQQEKLSGNSIDVSSLSNGIYIIRFTNNKNEISLYKFIKQ